jgi:hypothetical protein
MSACSHSAKPSFSAPASNRVIAGQIRQSYSCLGTQGWGPRQQGPLERLSPGDAIDGDARLRIGRPRLRVSLADAL